MLELKKPPMGWNSYDYYDTTVTEDQVKANADYMAEHLKSHGWEYVVVDIEWYSYDAGSQRDKHQYIPFWEVEMDEYSRLLPCPQLLLEDGGLPPWQNMFMVWDLNLAFISCGEFPVSPPTIILRFLGQSAGQMRSPVPIPSAHGIQICMG